MGTARPTTGLVARFFGELTVIILGVLIALWVDAWVDGRADRQAQDRLLVSLAEELETNLIALDSTVAREGVVLDAMRGLIDVHNGSRDNLSTDSLKALIVESTSYWRSNHHGVAFGVYDAMVATGSAELLPTRDLGLRLAKHRADIEKGQGDEPYAERAFEDLLEVLRRYGGWYSVTPGPLLERLSLPPLPREPDLDGLLRDPAFAEALYSRILWEVNISTFYAEQMAELEITLDLLRSEIGGGG